MVEGRTEVGGGEVAPVREETLSYTCKVFYSNIKISTDVGISIQDNPRLSVEPTLSAGL